jgi:hypothetical protein
MPEPLLSVVVPSVNGWSDLDPCLRALEAERRQTPLEVLVPERCGADHAGPPGDHHPDDACHGIRRRAGSIGGCD